MNYRPFRRNFYIEVPELARMSEAETAEYRKQLDGIKVRPAATVFHAHSLARLGIVTTSARIHLATSPWQTQLCAGLRAKLVSAESNATS